MCAHTYAHALQGVVPCTHNICIMHMCHKTFFFWILFATILALVYATEQQLLCLVDGKYIAVRWREADIFFFQDINSQIRWGWTPHELQGTGAKRETGTIATVRCIKVHFCLCLYHVLKVPSWLPVIGHGRVPHVLLYEHGWGKVLWLLN